VFLLPLKPMVQSQYGELNYIKEYSSNGELWGAFTYQFESPHAVIEPSALRAAKAYVAG
jgi:hypothetical protein